ncbi:MULTISPECIES: RDD family protein [Micrococcaceae]|uniref:RDD family membrane protein YckC n=1 Tax=Pseudarthrobacter niigatensis TaxID=369935 RepID=A0AAJ1WH95_9MICC|nr:MULTISPECIES: RDD family protein [Micrococcaceae]MDQ0147595.1 putative RDD family membrane protein YckC [Pseudarthrobacter niigatensis]MDQ0267536.1 putative RDD family membrane protein YckC [Pseudarthrobacter niigatensis]QDG63937.1 RDD family protein [Pseudarthrobacter sp. NIBRBAC000502771]UTT71071.1 RDD family protein [Arthrobacter sp. DNA4]WRT15510.1 RDD family protein [Pseudarthrobacter sp. LT1]
MVDRKDIGSWLTGPDTSGISKYPGERLGLPESGPGSIARAGRRIVAIMIDWGIALLISNFAFGGDSWATLAVFAIEQTLLVGTLGYSIGHRIMGIAVIKPGGGTPGPLAGLVRAVLLCLVIPAVIFDPDQRGLHDKAMNTLLIRR